MNSLYNNPNLYSWNKKIKKKMMSLLNYKNCLMIKQIYKNKKSH